MKKEIKDQKMTQRYTSAQRDDIENRARQFGMQPSVYIASTMCSEATIKKHTKYLKCHQAVLLTTFTNRLYDLINRTDSDSVPKAELIPIVDDIQKRSANIWKR